MKQTSLYERDYADTKALNEAIRFWIENDYRVLVWGYSSLSCKVYTIADIGMFS